MSNNEEKIPELERRIAVLESQIKDFNDLKKNLLHLVVGGTVVGLILTIVRMFNIV